VAAAAAALAALLAGCGGGNAESGAAQLHRGKQVFARSCSSCHSLTGHDTARPGGDLGVAMLSSADVASFVRVMPVRLARADVAAVADYVHAAERQYARR
jgi:mono/diheme cytochrome c family protein